MIYYLINGKIKRFTRRHHFFSSKRIFKDFVMDKKIEFQCKLCPVILSASLRRSENLFHHFFLDNHNSFLTWRLYEENSNSTFSMEILELLKFLVSSYSSFMQAKNEHFANILKPNLKSMVLCYRTFRYKRLPEIYNDLKKGLDIRLNNAQVKTLVVDIVVSKHMNKVKINLFCY